MDDNAQSGMFQDIAFTAKQLSIMAVNESFLAVKAISGPFDESEATACAIKFLLPSLFSCSVLNS